MKRRDENRIKRERREFGERCGAKRRVLSKKEVKKKIIVWAEGVEESR